MKTTKKTVCLTILQILTYSLFINGCDFFNDKISIKNNNINKQETPDIILKDYHTSSYNKGNLLWILKSKQAKIFEEKVITHLKKIYFTNFNITKKSVESSVFAERGFVENKTQNLTLIDNVVIINSENTIISGDYFYWNYSTKLFTSTNRVTIVKSDGSHITGIGFKADQNLGNIQFDKQVSGILGESKESDDSFFEGF